MADTPTDPGLAAFAATPPPLPADAETASARVSGMLCPYCGNVSQNKKECDRCRGVFEPLSRQASQNGMGPWYIRDEANPFRPGCSYATMRMLVARKRIVPESVLRGPSTRQFWTFAKNTPGIAHLLGECHACHKSAMAEMAKCAHCGASFGVEEDRQYLGLAEVRLIPGQVMPEVPRPRATTAVTTAHVSGGRQQRAAETGHAVDFAADAIPLAAEGDIASEPPPVQSAYEPIRDPSRPLRGELSSARIDELLRQSGAAERARRSSTVVIALVSVAVLAVVMLIVTAAIVVSRAANAPPPVTPVAPAPIPAGAPASVYPPVKSPPQQTP